ncbi:MAG: phosphoribosylamine--glycine ligase [Polyangiaceae bacterium]
MSDGDGTAMVLGSGGREHALAWALSRSPSIARVIVAPGNAGTATADTIRNVALDVTDPAAVAAAARELEVDLVVVGPEAPLCAGVVDALDEVGITAFGPTRGAARLEGSKAFMKRFATRHRIPTADYIITSDYAEAERYIRERGARVVVKADGLAGGKGAVVTKNAAEATAAAKAALVDGAFGDAGKTIVIEDLLPGEEMSVHVISDGERWLTLPVSRDHKRIGDGDTGPNTGGMGAFAPVVVNPDLMSRIQDEVIRPSIDGMRADGAPYRGVLYAGLMIAPDGTPNLLEHNVRFGDPETQVLLSLLDGDLAALLASAARRDLDESAVTVPRRHAVTVVLAAEGYPASPRKGDAIEGLDEAAAIEGARVFHAGTRLEGDHVVTSGGRVLGVCGVGDTARDARDRAYRAADRIRWRGMQLRRDIAKSAIVAS